MDAGMPTNILQNNKQNKDTTFEDHIKSGIEERKRLKGLHEKMNQDALRKRAGMPAVVPADPLIAAITEVVLNEGSETETLPIADLIVDLPSGEQFATTDQIFGQDNNGVALEDAAKIFAPYVDIAPDLPKLDIKDLKVPNRTEDGTIKSGVRSPNGMPDRIK